MNQCLSQWETRWHESIDIVICRRSGTKITTDSFSRGANGETTYWPLISTASNTIIQISASRQME